MPKEFQELLSFSIRHASSRLHPSFIHHSVHGYLYPPPRCACRFKKPPHAARSAESTFLAGRAPRWWHSSSALAASRTTNVRAEHSRRQRLPAFQMADGAGRGAASPRIHVRSFEVIERKRAPLGRTGRVEIEASSRGTTAVIVKQREHRGDVGLKAQDRRKKEKQTNERTEVALLLSYTFRSLLFSVTARCAKPKKPTVRG